MDTRIPVANACWIYRCEDIAVDTCAHTVTKEGLPIPLEPKAYAVLLALLENAGHLIDKDSLLDAVWGHRNVTPSALSRTIAQLRHALGDSVRQPHYIATVHCLGYRFISGVCREQAGSLVEIPALRNTRNGDSSTPVAHSRIERRVHADRRLQRDRRGAPPLVRR